MREILFRGKRIDNGEWVLSGNIIRLIPENGEDLIFIQALSEPCTCCHDEKDNIIAFEKGIFYKVDTKTVGQYTCLKDKNGKRIFEGDIVKTDKFSEPNKQYIIKYDLQFGAFIGQDRYNIYFVTFDCDSGEVEVIGNIHDKPELLEK